MAFRGGNNRNRNFGGGNFGGPMSGNRMGGNMNMSPWDNQNMGGGFGGNMRQGGGGQGMNTQAINLANNLLNSIFRNQNPPSLLDLPRGGGGGGGMGNRNQRGGPMVNRPGPGNRVNNRRIQGGFQNRGAPGAKPAPPKQNAGGIRKQNAFDRAKKLLAKNATNKKKDSTSSDNKKIESKESPYASVPNDMFYCHLCKKHMWDANSFENHIKGRTHLMMREGIEESYRLKANMIRQEAKIAEQLKSIELDRLKRMGKSKQRQLDYCTMCDLNFHGHLSSHRKSEGHLQLKKFLHPRCSECNKEFATRIDYDSHLLSADHLKKAAEKNTKVGERPRNTLTILTEEDELKDVRPPQKRRKKPTKKSEGGAGTNAEGEKKDGEEGGEGDEGEGGEEVGEKKGEDGIDDTKEGDDMNETQEEEEVILPVDPEDCIIDYQDGDEIPTEVDTRLPKYNWTRPVGSGLITKLECYECSLCGKFLDTEATVEVHARTVTHHRNFLKFINEKSSDTKIAQKRAAAALEENERKKRKIEEAEAASSAEGASVDIKTEIDEADNKSGNNETNEEATEDVGEEAGDEAAQDESEEVVGEIAEGKEDLYDPSEATGDDEDVEMVENGNVEDDVVCLEEGNGTEEMETQEEVEEIEEVNVKVEPETKIKREPAAAEKIESKPQPMKTPTKPAPVAAVNTPAHASTPAAAATTAPDASPAKKPTPGPRNSAIRGTPRGRGRGRYNRY